MCDEKAIATLHQDMRAIAAETPKSAARTRVGHRYYPSRFVQAADRAFEHDAIANYVGLVPSEHSSGQSRRHTGGGSIMSAAAAADTLVARREKNRENQEP
jgi:hypothetical protein